MKKLLYFVLIFSVFVGFKAWFFIGSTVNWPLLVSPALLVLAFANKDLFQSTSRKWLFFVLSYVLLVIGSSLTSAGGFVWNLLSNIPLFLIIFFRDRYRIEALRIFDKVMLFVTTISMAGWLLYLLGVSLPHSTLVFDVDGEAAYQFENYYVFLGPNTLQITFSLFERFSCIFYEPGYFAIILVFLILYHKFDYKNVAVWIYTAALFLSFSLAGYIMFTLMWVGLLLSKSSKGIPYLLLIIALLYGGQEFFKNYKGGDNAVNELIIARMIIEDGDWSGYNRTGATFDDDFEKFVKNGGSKLFIGVSKQEAKNLDRSNVGWKVYIYQRGLLCFFVFIACVLLIYYPYRRILECAIPVILFFLAFARGHHVMWFSGFWLLWIGIMNDFYQQRNSVTGTSK